MALFGFVQAQIYKSISAPATTIDQINNEYPYLKDRVKVIAVNADDFEDTKDYNENPFKRSIVV